mmetsp:Transcript_32372/g.82513  ORF Transcript_32372/g.82513 Transcript_32372/m.82513 type:complete len:232 (-) Transcript_32372:3079-3774(-)
MPFPSGVAHFHWIAVDVVVDALAGLAGAAGPAVQTPPSHDHPAVMLLQLMHAPEAPWSSQTSVPLSTPSPHTWQLDRLLPSEVVASVQVESASSAHAAEHPSPSASLPSSHASALDVRCPSPQTVTQALVQLEQTLVQLYPVSTSQAAEQPSPSAALPSSHCSLAVSSSPFWHPSLHVSGVRPAHDHPDSTKQEPSHPSPVAVPPSSHCSDPCRALSPHTVVDRISALSAE